MAKKKVNSKHQTIERRINESVNGLRLDCLTLYKASAWKAHGMSVKDYAEKRLHALGYSMFKKHVNAAQVEEALCIEVNTHSLRSMLPLYPYINSGELKNIWCECKKKSKKKKLTEKIVVECINKFINRNNQPDDEIEQLIVKRNEQLNSSPSVEYLGDKINTTNENITRDMSNNSSVTAHLSNNSQLKHQKLQLKFISGLRQYNGLSNFYQFVYDQMLNNFDKKTLKIFAKKLSNEINKKEKPRG